jgi:hypothetical protein
MNCLIYSGFTRNWDKQNHKDTFGDALEVHHNEHNADLSFYHNDIFGYSSNIYYHEGLPDNVPHRVLNMWHNMWQAFVKAPLGLNVYVRMRYDTIFDKPIDLASYQLSNNRVYIPSGVDWRGGVNDWTAFGTYEVMQKYYSVYMTHQMFFHQGKTFHPESYLKYTLEHLGIEIVRIPQTHILAGGLNTDLI